MDISFVLIVSSRQYKHSWTKDAHHVVPCVEQNVSLQDTKTKIVSIAQSVERMPFKHVVEGSIPSRYTWDIK